jgi:hypothetical protein
MACSGRAYYDSKQAADAEVAEIVATADHAKWVGDRVTGIRAIQAVFAVLDDRMKCGDWWPTDDIRPNGRQSRSKQ